MGLLSPLFLQFLAWKNLTHLNKEIKDFVTSPENSDVKKENVLSAIKKFSSHSMISVQKNTISKYVHSIISDDSNYQSYFNYITIITLNKIKQINRVY